MLYVTEGKRTKSMGQLDEKFRVHNLPHLNYIHNLLNFEVYV